MTLTFFRSWRSINAESQEEGCQEEKGPLRRQDQGRQEVQTHGLTAVEVLPSAQEKKIA